MPTSNVAAEHELRRRAAERHVRLLIERLLPSGDTDPTIVPSVAVGLVDVGVLDPATATRLVRAHELAAAVRQQGRGRLLSFPITPPAVQHELDLTERVVPVGMGLDDGTTAFEIAWCIVRRTSIRIELDIRRADDPHRRGLAHGSRRRWAPGGQSRRRWRW